ncbi:DNA-directed DNA polymerase [Tanacetum coccineum]
MNVSSISEAMQPTFRGRLKRACNQISYLEAPTREVGLKNPYLFCDYCGGSHEAHECRQNNPAEQVYLSGGDIYDDPSLLSRTTIPHHGGTTNVKKKERMVPNGLLEIHINQPFLEAMIHMPKGAKVLKDLISHKEKLKKAASSVKLREECPAIIQRSLPQKEGDPGSFTLPCLIGPLAVKNALDDLGNLLVNVSKFIFPVDFVVLEMNEDEIVPIILGRPFLATARAVIDVYERKLSLRVGSETVTFNIGKSMKSKHSRDDYLYCADHTTKHVHEQWADTVDHDKKWTEVEEEKDSNEVQAVSFYPRTEPVKPLEWKASKNRLKPSSIKPPKLELKELPEHLEYAFL